MFGFLLILMILTFLLWIGFKITGALLVAFFWVFVLLPLTLIIWLIALLCCCTLILIPVGIWLFKLGFRVLIP